MKQRTLVDELVAAGAKLGTNKECPHWPSVRLTNVEPVCGVIVCPFHKLCFDAQSGVVITTDEARARGALAH